MQRCEREISKEIYDRAMENHGYIADEDMDKVFSDAEMLGYGVYSPVVAHLCDRYVVRFEMGDTCD